MNYWWNRNLSGIWAIFIWTYSPYLCTGILTAFFNFSFGFWIYRRRFSFFKHLVHLHYKCGLCQGLWACCHHKIQLTTISSFPLSFPLCWSWWHLGYRGVPEVCCHGIQAGETGIIWDGLCGLLSVWFSSVLFQKTFLLQFPSTGLTEANQAAQKLLVRLTK